MKKYKTVEDLLKNKTRWTRFAYARNKYGKAVKLSSSHATRFCLTGALIKIYGSPQTDKHIDANFKLFKTLRKKSRKYGGPIFFNDTHTHAEVLNLVKQAKI
jgi:hypothetical protein